MRYEKEDIRDILRNGGHLEVTIESSVSAIEIIRDVQLVWQEALNILERGEKVEVQYEEVRIEDALIVPCIDFAANIGSRPAYNELRKLAGIAQNVLLYVEKDEKCLQQDYTENISYNFAKIKDEANYNLTGNEWYYYNPTNSLRDWVAQIDILSELFDESRESEAQTSPAPLQIAENLQENAGAEADKYPAEILMLFKQDKASIDAFLNLCKINSTAKFVAGTYRDFYDKGKALNIAIERAIPKLYDWLNRNNAIIGKVNNLNKAFAQRKM